MAGLVPAMTDEVRGLLKGDAKLGKVVDGLE
jgi:hypothetical protein